MTFIGARDGKRVNTDIAIIFARDRHGACPVIAGQKWTAVKWIRVARFDGDFQSELPMIPLTRRTDKQPCVDEWDECEAWAQRGWCELNPDFMKKVGARDSLAPACARSCGLCATQ